MEKKLCKDDENYNNKRKVKDHCHYTGKFRGAAHSKCSLNYKIPKDIPIIINNASYDIHFIINQLAEEFKGELNCIGENMEKYITFSVPIKKECDDSKIITYKLRFIVSFRFMSASLSEVVDNLSGKIFNSIVCTKCMEREKINLEYKFDGLKDNRLSYKCRQCREIWYDLINGLIKKFPIIYQFCNGDLNKFILLLRKGVYRYEYMDSWQKFDETTLPPKEVFHSSNLNLQDISNEDYMHAQKVWGVFELKIVGEYHDLYVKSDTLLLADMFENFRNKCLEIYELNPIYFAPAPGLAWQACLKKTGVNIRIRINI